MTIALASDHGGYELKNIILGHLKEKNIETIDYGVYSCAPSDYPDSAVPVCEAVLSKKADLGILACGTGIGISISANKIHGIRCALLCDVFSAKMARAHNNVNVMAIGGRVIGPGHALEIVDAFLSTPFSNEERHERRVQKIMELEKR
jgi:ribose 5-phosphate isomerase B